MSVFATIVGEQINGLAAGHDGPAFRDATVNFTATNADIVPTLAISFYGWDSKHYIIPAHERDGNRVDEGCGPTSTRPGCNIEWSPGSTKPFFTEETGSVAGDWIVTFDMSLYQSYKTDPIPTLIATVTSISTMGSSSTAFAF